MTTDDPTGHDEPSLVQKTIDHALHRGIDGEPEPEPTNLDGLQEKVAARLEYLDGQLSINREVREDLNARIRQLVAERDEAYRAFKALTPRTKKGTK